MPNRRGYSKHRPALPLYTVEDAERSLELLRPVSYADEIELADGLSCRFTRVGHILGAAAIRIGFDTAGGKRFLVDSGDLGRYGRPILKDPDPIEHADWLLLESTYGNRTHPTNSEDELAKVINKVAIAKGCLVIPSFAVGRTQEIIYSIRTLEDRGKIPAIPCTSTAP